VGGTAFSEVAIPSPETSPLVGITLGILPENESYGASCKGAHTCNSQQTGTRHREPQPGTVPRAGVGLHLGGAPAPRASPALSGCGGVLCPAAIQGAAGNAQAPPFSSR